MRYFLHSEKANLELVLTNNASSGVIERAARFMIPCKVFNKNDFYQSETILTLLQENKIDLVVLAGFLWLVPENLINAFPNQIINIHPALLPGFGGKGLYGTKVHQAVVDSGARMSGITIHYVNKQFDDGEIIFQAACHVSRQDTPDSLALKIHQLEYLYLPVVIEKIVSAV